MHDQQDDFTNWDVFQALVDQLGEGNAISIWPSRTGQNVVRGQYVAGCSTGEDDLPAYALEPDVDSGSEVETYVAVKLMVDNDRWRGVPFYLRTGKRMVSQTTKIAHREGEL